MIDLYIYCNTVRLFSLCLPLLDVGIDSLQEHLEIHLQNPLIRLVVFCLEECRPKNPRHHYGPELWVSIELLPLQLHPCPSSCTPAFTAFHMSLLSSSLLFSTRLCSACLHCLPA